ncbi:MAG: hypothetical protein AAF512_05365 [Pseudomonadota bacterium]
MGDVVQKIEENFQLAECFKAGEATCPLVNACGLNQALSRALQGFLIYSMNTRWLTLRSRKVQYISF